MSTTRPVRVYIMQKALAQSGHAKYERVVLHERATFHRFGTEYEEFDAGPAMYPCAVVELADGNVISPPAAMIQFLDRTAGEGEYPTGPVQKPALLN